MVLADNADLAFYNEGLQKHQADGDLVNEPGLLWAPASRRKGGLSAHLSVRADSEYIKFTDVLLIINRADWARAVPTPTSTWPDEAARALSARFMQLCEEQDIHLRYPQRPLQFHIIQDGGPRMENTAIGLKPGEFVTSLLSNQYGRPTSHSRALIAIHLNLPGVWPGYYEVGRLYNDQALFTLGNHWLDNFSHPALMRSALYRLQQQVDGSFVHVIDPEVAEAYDLTAQESGDGPSVLSIQNRNGEAIAHLVLEVVSEGPFSVDPNAKTQVGDPLGNSDAEQVTAINDVPRNSQTITSDVRGSQTVVPEALSERILTLRERGALLQKVHFSRFMLGYDVYVGAAGEVGTAIRNPVATLQVRKKKVTLVSHTNAVRVNGVAVPVNESCPLDGDTNIDVGGVVVEYCDLRSVAAAGWPYLGEVRRKSSSPIHLLFNKQHAIGRARSSQVNLPDKPHNDNIVWRPEVGEGSTIRARSGEIPKSQFYTDSIMVASRHAEIDLAGEPVLNSTARHCYTFVRRDETVYSLYPTNKQAGATNLDLQPSDHILIGNSVFEVDYLPVGAERRAAELNAPPPDITASQMPASPLSPAALAAAVDDEDDETGEVGPDLPAAAGLGERGPVPQPVVFAQEIDPIGAPPPLPEIALPKLSVDDHVPPDISAPMMVDAFNEEAGSGSAPSSDPISPLDAPSLTGIAAERPPRMPSPPPLPEPIDEDDIFDILDAGPEEVEPFSFDEPAGSPPPVPPVADSGPPPVPPVADSGPPPVPPVVDDGPPPMPPVVDDSPPSVPEDVLSPVASLEGLEAVSDSFESDTVPSEVANSVSSRAEPVNEGAAETPALPEASDVRAPAGAAPSVAAGAGDGREVVVVDESNWQVELSRPARLAVVGWMASGDVLVGNHRDADVILPENRAEPEQVFEARDYFRLVVRGRRARLALLDESEARLQSEGDAVQETKDAGALMEVVRRDPDGEPDFEVQLRLRPERMLPDPRARLLALDTDESMVTALFAIGFPLRKSRQLHMGRLRFSALYDGEEMMLTDYLDSYVLPDGDFRPFFIKHGTAPFRTAPEDGSPIRLQPGDHLLVGVAVYRFDHG